MKSSTIILTLSLCIFCSAHNKIEKDDKTVIIDAANKFSVKLFTELASHRINENLLVSPLSAWLALTMTTYGAAGHTLEQMQKSLFLPDDNAIAFSGLRQLMDELMGTKNIDCALANKIYVSNQLELNQYFDDIVKNVFSSIISYIDKCKPKEAAEEINKWVSDATYGRINHLVDEDEIKSTMRMLLLNAVYFKGEWKTEFDASETIDRPFHTGINIGITAKLVPMMSVIDNFFWGDLPDYGVKFIQIPYKNEDAKMTIIVPYGFTSLQKAVYLLDSLNASLFAEVGYESRVNLTLPKFKIENTLHLNNPLNRLGLADLFNSFRANFTNMSKERLQINKVKQRAFIQVNEKGSEAAAVTDVQIGFKSSLDSITAFNVNRPSLFLITVKNITIFMGRIGNPEY